MARRSVAGLLPVDFFTQGYRISGHLSVMGKTVADTLNDRLTSYLELSDVYISRLGNPAEIVTTYAESQLNKDSLLFAIVPAKERLARAGRSTSYFGRELHQVWLALPGLEIEGKFEMTGLSLDWKAYLAKEVSYYIPVLNGTARLTIQPEISFSGEAFLVNRAHIDLFCIEEEAEQ
jgi:hypothetical protein